MLEDKTETQTSTLDITTLPNELWITHIFPYLDVLTLGQAMQVSKHWKMLANQEAVWMQRITPQAQQRIQNLRNRAADTAKRTFLDNPWERTRDLYFDVKRNPSANILARVEILPSNAIKVNCKDLVTEEDKEALKSSSGAALVCRWEQDNLLIHSSYSIRKAGGLCQEKIKNMVALKATILTVLNKLKTMDSKTPEEKDRVADRIVLLYNPNYTPTEITRPSAIDSARLSK